MRAAAVAAAASAAAFSASASMAVGSGAIGLANFLDLGDLPYFLDLLFVDLGVLVLFFGTGFLGGSGTLSSITIPALRQKFSNPSKSLRAHTHARGKTPHTHMLLGSALMLLSYWSVFVLCAVIYTT